MARSVFCQAGLTESRVRKEKSTSLHLDKEAEKTKASDAQGERIVAEEQLLPCTHSREMKPSSQHMTASRSPAIRARVSMAPLRPRSHLRFGIWLRRPGKSGLRDNVFRPRASFLIPRVAVSLLRKKATFPEGAKRREDARSVAVNLYYASSIGRAEAYLCSPSVRRHR